MPSFTQTLQQQQRELRQQAPRSRSEELRLQQESLQRGVSKSKILSAREEQRTLIEAQQSPPIKEIESIIYSNEQLRAQLSDQIEKIRRDIEVQRAIKTTNPEDHRRQLLSLNISNTQINSINTYINNIGVAISNLQILIFYLVD